MVLNEKKIRLMTKLASFEKKEEKGALRLAQFYKIDYIRFELLKTILSVTIAYIMVLIMIILYHSEDLIINALDLDYVEIGRQALGGYIITLIVYLFIAAIGYHIRFVRSRKKVRLYHKLLSMLRKIYKKEEEC